MNVQEYRALSKKSKPSKYGNTRCQHDGYSFDSLAELKHYRGLKLRVRSRQISKLVVHPRWAIVVNDVKICTYDADFSYVEKGHPVIIDVKGCLTGIFRIKEKLMKAVHGIDVELVKV